MIIVSKYFNRKKPRPIPKDECFIDYREYNGEGLPFIQNVFLDCDYDSLEEDGFIHFLKK